MTKSKLIYFLIDKMKEFDPISEIIFSVGLAVMLTMTTSKLQQLIQIVVYRCNSRSEQFWKQKVENAKLEREDGRPR